MKLVHPPKILIGTSNVAGLIHQYAKGFSENGFQVTTLILYKYTKPSFYTETFDVYMYKLGDLVLGSQGTYMGQVLNVLFNRISWLRKYIVTKYIIDRNDLFLYVWGQESLLPDKEDLKIIKKKGKKIIHLFLGSDARLAEAFMQEFDPGIENFHSVKTDQKDFEFILKNVRTVELYADLIYSVPDQAGMQMKPYNHLLLPYDGQNISFSKRTNKVLKVIHCPSNKSMKGTDTVLEIVKKLQQDINFSFELLQDIPNEEILRRLEKSDILIDELVLNGPGVLSYEAMYAGCIVLTKYTEKNVSYFNPPIIKVDAFNLEEKLREILTLNPEERYKLAEQARIWVENYGSPKKICKKIYEDILNQETMEYDYYPNSKDEFQLPEYLSYPSQMTY